MDANVISALISGGFSVASALGAVFLKEYLDSRRKKVTISHVKPSASTATELQKTDAPQDRAAKIWKQSALILRPALIVLGSLSYGMLMANLAWGRWDFSISLGIFKAWIGLFVIALIMAFYHRNKGFLLSFQLENFALWSGFASGLALVAQGSIEKYFGGMIPSWIGSAIVGGILVIWRQKKTPN